MAGNVWEWTASGYEPGSGKRVLRGGSWLYDQRLARCAFRHGGIPDVFGDHVGLRVVLSPDSPAF